MATTPTESPVQLLVDYANSHREALGYPLFPSDISLEDLNTALAMIEANAPFGVDPWCAAATVPAELLGVQPLFV